MTVPHGSFPSHSCRLGLSPFSGLALFLVLGLGIVLPQNALGQADTTDAAPPDTTQRPPSTSRPPSGADTTDASQQPLRPPPPVPPLYGRVQTDSMPGRLPHVTLEMILAEQPGSFLYDLGEYGWPHGWSPRGLAPHRVHLWLDGLPLDDPLTGRARFELLPPSFVTRPRTGLDPGGGAVGVHTRWRSYPPKRPLTEIRYRFDREGLHAVEVGHSQKRRLDLFGRPGLLHATLGYAGRKADGVYDGSALQSERRLWGRLRYQTNDWTVELSDRASRFRIGAHGGAVPPVADLFTSIYALPVAASSVRRPNNRRKTVRNDLTARMEAPLLPGLENRTLLSTTWTSHTFDFRSGGGTSDTTWSVKLNGGHAHLQQSLTAGPHHLTGDLRGSLWSVADDNVPQIDGSRGEIHFQVRDSLRLGRTALRLHAGGHATSEQTYPSFTLRAQRPVGPFQISASGRVTGQRDAWIEEAGFTPHVNGLDGERAGIADRLIEATLEARTEVGPFDLGIEGFAHQIRSAVDLYADVPEDTPPTTITDTVTARQSPSPVQRAGVTLSLDWRRDARRGLYAQGQGTLLEPLTAGASPLHARLARTMPKAFGRARIGARFVLFTDLITDFYVQARGWSAMNSRWFHPPTGRLVVPPLQTPIPNARGLDVGPNGTVDVRAEAHFLGATLFFTFQNVQAGTQLQPGTFVVPVYPLPPQQFRFGVFWPIFD